MNTVSEQSIEAIQPHWDSSKTPSFSALVKERFILDIFRAVRKYGEYLGMEYETASLDRTVVTSFEIASGKLDFDVICHSSFMDNGERHKETLLISCICCLNDDFSRIHVAFFDFYTQKHVKNPQKRDTPCHCQMASHALTLWS